MNSSLNSAFLLLSCLPFYCINIKSEFQSDMEGVESCIAFSIPYIRYSRHEVVCIHICILLLGKKVNDDNTDSHHIEFLLYARQYFVVHVYHLQIKKQSFYLICLKLCR